MKNTNDLMVELRHVHQGVLAYLQKHWRIFLTEGVFFILLGVAAILIPQAISVAIVIFLAWLIVLAGVMHIARALFLRNMPGFSLWLGLGVLQMLVGYLLIANPITAVLTLTMMMTLFFGLEGILKIYLALMMRPLPHWNGVLFSGLTALLFAVVVLVFWPETEHWLLGVFIGLNMAMLGGAMVKISLHYKGHHG